MTRAIGRLSLLLLLLLALAPAPASAQGLQCGAGGNASCFAMPIVPQAGIVGTATNDSAAPGQIGEYPSITVPVGTPVALTTGTVATVATLPLTAGNFLCAGSVGFAPGATTTATEFDGALSLAPAALPTSPGAGALAIEVGSFAAANAAQVMPVGMMRVSLATGANVYLVVKSVFAVSTNAAYGFVGCLRVR